MTQVVHARNSVRALASLKDKSEGSERKFAQTREPDSSPTRLSLQPLEAPIASS